MDKNDDVVLFQVWKVYQRRAESMAHYFDADIKYYHYPWEEKSKWLKAASYLLKSLFTLADLIKYRPKVVIVQLPPTPALFVVGVYSYITHTPYVADCHNAMILRQWLRWPLARTLLKRAAAVLVHNENVCEHARADQIRAVVIRDPLPPDRMISDTGVLKRFGLEKYEYVIVPWNFQSDEPIGEFIEAVRSMPDIKFAMTWFAEKLPANQKENLPENLLLTGYLQEPEFTDLFKSSGAAISLTTQQGIQPSAAAEAIAYGVPIILSDMVTARTLYKSVPVYVRNEAPAIVEGVHEVFRHQESYRKGVTEFKKTLEVELENEFASLRATLP